MANIKPHRDILRSLEPHLPPGYRAEITKHSGQCKHYRLVVTGPQGSRFMSVPGSPRSAAEQLNYARQWLRRALRELGA